MDVLKAKVVNGYLRRIEEQMPRDQSRTMADSLIWLIILYVDGEAVFVAMLGMVHSREIIHIQVGQCGNRIGTEFWKTVNTEHHLDASGRVQTKSHKKPDRNDTQRQQDVSLWDKLHVYYNQADAMRFVPRSVCVDLDPGTLDGIRASPLGMLFKPDNYIFGASGAGNSWPKGHYIDGAELIDEVRDVVRREAEGCDCPQAFQLTHSIGGGTGGGLGTLIQVKIRDDYPDRISSTFTVFPSPKVSDIVVEPYNAILSIHQLLENADETFVIDNEALFNISHNVLKQKEPKYADLNWVVSKVMSGITASLRFPGELNCDLRKMGVNLIPFPRLHFFLVAQAPLFASGEGETVQLTVQELTAQMWSSRHFLCNVKSEDGKYLAASCGYRGAMASQEVEDEVAKFQQMRSEEFVTWIPDHIKTSIIRVPPEDYPISGTLVANTTAIKGVFQRIAAQFARMFRRKAFLYRGNGGFGVGMDEMEFQEADKNCRDLICEYQDQQDVVVELESSGNDNQDEDENEHVHQHEQEEL